MGTGIYFHLISIQIFTHSSNQFLFPFTVNIFPLSIDADKQLADNLSQIAAFNVENLLLETSETRKGAIDNVCQSLLKEWGPESLSALPLDTIQKLLTEVIILYSSNRSILLHLCQWTYSIIWVISFLSGISQVKQNSTLIIFISGFESIRISFPPQ